MDFIRSAGTTEVILESTPERLSIRHKTELDNIESYPLFAEFVNALVVDAMKHPEKLHEAKKVWDKEWDELRNKLSNEEFRHHEIVKLAYRIREADQEIIPRDPNRPEYRLTGNLKKYRRYKQELQRYRLFFCFSNQPKIILVLS